VAPQKLDHSPNVDLAEFYLQETQAMWRGSLDHIQTWRRLPGSFQAELYDKKIMGGTNSAFKPMHHQVT